MQISNCVNSNISEVRKQTTNHKNKTRQTNNQKQQQKTNKKQQPKFGQQRSYYIEKAKNKQNTT